MKYCNHCRCLTLTLISFLSCQQTLISDGQRTNSLDVRSKATLFRRIILGTPSIDYISAENRRTASGAPTLAHHCPISDVSEKVTVQQAAEKGLEPCKICKPAAMSVQQNLVDKAKGESNTIQCSGLTKKDSRCRHMTSIADGFCFQHRRRQKDSEKSL